MHPGRKALLCVFSGDVAVYGVEPTGAAALAENEESDAPSPADAASVTLTQPEGGAPRVKLADVDIKKAVFSEDGKILAIGLETGEVQVVSWPELKVTRTLGKHSDGVTGMAFSPDGKFLLTTSSEPANKPDKGAAVWSVALGERVRTLCDPSLPPNARGTQYRFAAFGPPERAGGAAVAYTGLNLGGEGYVVKWETEGWTVKAKAKVTRDPISAMAMAPDASTVAVGNSEGHVTVVNTSNLGVVSTDRGAHMIFVTTMAGTGTGGRPGTPGTPGGHTGQHPPPPVFSCST